ncbi:MAG: outer membrane lipid asymmetry maintenance protein MlaD [Pseudomonadota bacterium]|nr:outer membrane lipid asymmetry maintenance protein MlaD [Pseudomonadota bacterium]
MPSNKLHFFAGLFVLAGLLALIFLALRVSGLSFSSEESVYEVKAKFTELGGLRERAKVSMGGVNIGSVSDISLNNRLADGSMGDFKAVVTFNINSRYDNIPIDSSAEILTAGILGEKYIGITPGSACAPGFDDEPLSESELSACTLKQGSTMEYTQSAMVLEKLISQFLVNMTESGED